MRVVAVYALKLKKGKIQLHRKIISSAILTHSATLCALPLKEQSDALAAQKMACRLHFPRLPMPGPTAGTPKTFSKTSVARETYGRRPIEGKGSQVLIHSSTSIKLPNAHFPISTLAPPNLDRALA